jgi:hypothetical protein
MLKGSGGLPTRSEDKAARRSMPDGYFAALEGFSCYAHATGGHAEEAPRQDPASYPRLSIRGISDIAKLRVRFVNRNSGSGTRVWFDTELRKLEIPTEKIHGYNKEVMAHSDAAVLIANDKADVSLGLQAAAHQLKREIERADGRDHSHGTASPEAEIFLSAWSCVQLNCRLLHICILVGCVSSLLPLNSVMGFMVQNTILPMKR